MPEPQAPPARLAAAVATASAAVTIAAVVGGKATRDALFLGVYPASALPRIALVTAVLSLAAVLGAARLMHRLGPGRLVPALFALGALAHACEWPLVHWAPGLGANVVYLHVTAMAPLLVSGVWSVMGERFDPYTAKRVFGHVSTGATVGGLVGGLVAERMASWFDARAMLLALALMNLLAGAGVSALARRGERRASHRDETQQEALDAVAEQAGSGESAPRDVGNPVGGLGQLRGSPLLVLLAWMVVLTTMTASMVDYGLKAQAGAALQSREQLMSFFALFYTATGLGTVLFQAALGRRSLARLGIGGTIALLPAAVLLTGLVGAAAMRLWSAALLRGTELVLRNSLFRGGYELLFTPVAPERKRATKTLIDVGCDRAGDAAASGLVLLAVTLAPTLAPRLIVGLALLAAVAALGVALRLHASYVAALADNLRSGKIELRASEVIDATTLHTLTEATGAIDRATLLRQIEQLRRAREEGAGPEGPPSLGRGSAGRPSLAPIEGSPARRALEQRAIELLAPEPARALAALEAPLEPELVGLVIPMLASSSLARAARRALALAAPRAVGQLVDALLDPRQDPKVSRRLPAILVEVESARSVRGLVAGLEDARALVRPRCLLALSELLGRRPDLRPPQGELLALAESALAGDPADLDHVFRLLSLAQGVEAVRLAHRALLGDDPTLRGTALEYLENVLPPQIHARLLARLPDLVGPQEPGAPQGSRPLRGPEELVAALSRAIRLRREPTLADHEDDAEG